MKKTHIRSETAPPYAATLSAPINEDQIIAQALEILARRHRKGAPLSSPADTAAFLQLQLAEREREFFAVLFLNSQHRVIALEELFAGTIDGAAIYSREVVKRALQLNSAAVILAHNHPSGIPEPSQADIAITGRIREALSLVDIRTLDHVIVGTSGTVSFAERGLI